jgi:hypothetical protein
MAARPKHDVPTPAPDRPEEPWLHSGFGSDSALEAMKRVARTRPDSHAPLPKEGRQAPAASQATARSQAKGPRRAGKQER